MMAAADVLDSFLALLAARLSDRGFLSLRPRNQHEIDRRGTETQRTSKRVQARPYSTAQDSVSLRLCGFGSLICCRHRGTCGLGMSHG